MTKPIIAAVIAVIVVVGGAFLLLHKSSKAPTANTASQSSASTTPKAAASNNAPATTDTSDASSPMNVTVNANDSSASPETITATKGQTVTIKFAVSTNGTYHGGLDFKSTDPAVDSGPIAEGTSKTVSFTATKSFKFTPFWYQSDVQKDYFVNVNVQ